jgi:hypothetical protein
MRYLANSPASLRRLTSASVGRLPSQISLSPTAKSRATAQKLARIQSSRRHGRFRARDQPQLDRVIANGKNDWDRRGRSFGCLGTKAGTGRRDHGHTTADELIHERRQAIVLAFQPVVLDNHILVFNVPRRAAQRCRRATAAWLVVRRGGCAVGARIRCGGDWTPPRGRCRCLTLDFSTPMSASLRKRPNCCVAANCRDVSGFE